MSRIRGVCQGLLIPSHAGSEDEFSESLTPLPIGLSFENGPVFENKVSTIQCLLLSRVQAALEILRGQKRP